MTGREVVDGPGGRRIIREVGQPDKVALPMHHVDNACTDDEKNLLLRLIEASEISKGNTAVMIVGNEARGRYADFAQRVEPETYARFEVEAYRWIMTTFGRENRALGEMFARMSGERVETTFEEWGQHIANSNNMDIALGAAIGTTRALAWSLKDAYARYYAHWKADQERKVAVTNSYRRRPQIIDGTSES